VRVAVPVLALLLAPAAAHAQAWHFTDVTAAAGLSYAGGHLEPVDTVPRNAAGGVAAGDFDGDGLTDLYVIRGDIGPNLLYRNRGDGTFGEVGARAGVAYTGKCSGPVFADFDGDGLVDLFVGGMEETPARLFRNTGDGTFEDVTERAGLGGLMWAFGATFGDYDRDGYLDLVTTHWTLSHSSRLWHNNGDGTFTEVTAAAGLSAALCNSFTANFADIDNDGWPDLLIAGDYGSSQVYLNNRDGTFRVATDHAVITDQFGMGATVGDFDGDGNLDWFVTSINRRELQWDGNRLYRGRGDGSFVEVSAAAGVRDGSWGWAASFQDFNNDGVLDIFMVNGYVSPDFLPFNDDPAKMFVGNGDGTFAEKAAELSIADTGQGSGIVCFDYDGDGDLDVFIANNGQPGVLYRNDGGNAGHWLRVVLRGDPPNTQAIGARVTLCAGGKTQIREIRAGSNFESQDPAEAFFGIGAADRIDCLSIRWPDGRVQELEGVPADQVLAVAASTQSGGVRPVRPPLPSPVTGRR
jgi:hypothetical protein